MLGGKNSPVCKYYNLWLIIWGGIIMSFTSITFYKTYFKFSNIVSIIGSIIFILFGVGACILSSIFSVEDKRSIESIEGKVHGIGSGVGVYCISIYALNNQ